jgi:hypothetical protein
MRNTWNNPSLEQWREQERLARDYRAGLRADGRDARYERRFRRPAPHKVLKFIPMPIVYKVGEFRFAGEN